MFQLSRGVLGAAPLRATVAACVASIALAACGGGGGYGGGGGMTSPPPTASISVAPTSITLGQSATLTWSSSTGTNCTASGAWTGSEGATGTKVVTPATSGSLTYTLSCGGGAYGGSTAKSAQLTVAAATAYTATVLVGDTPAASALKTDANLVNPWGVVFAPGKPAWVANNHSETSTLYDGNGKPQPAAAPLIVNFAPSGAVTFDPTGVVFSSSSTDFVVTSGTKSAPARFIFVGEGGMIAGWSPTVDATHAVTAYTDAGGAVYKGVTIANNGTANFLYAADFHNNKVDVFNATFAKQAPTATSFAFSDPTLPAGYAPFGIQALPTGASGAIQIYVAYAQQSPPDNHDNLDGAGLGLVDVYDANGAFVSHLIAVGGKLNAPWGLALAPSDFGTLSKTLLVGNFGDGKINAYDPATGAFIGTVADSTGAAFAEPGLWGIAFGNDAANQPHSTLFWAAGLNNEVNGAYGRIDAGNAPVLNAPPVVAITAPTGSVTGTVAVTATAQDNIAIAKVEFFAGTTSLGSVTTIANGTNVALTATATDVDGNVGTSPAVTVTVGAAVTLTQIQTDVFTPICSGCHTGVGAALPGVQNLTAGHSYASIVGVASIEKPALMRVKPGDAANSYLIEKLEGAAGIGGARMPLGGPYLDQATIDKIKAWINSGAANN
jgi:uncharacterized protein (TIGR03118 family)